jgi:putative endonuclease
MGPDRRAQGRAAEDRAAQYLLGLGYTIVTRRYQTRHGEIDIVALDGDTVVLVEVKERIASMVAPEECVGERKKKRIRTAATKYLAGCDPDTPIRYDLVAIDPSGLRHYPDAWRVG